jgi:hypothetical protein
MGYRDELEAAQARIASLESELENARSRIASLDSDLVRAHDRISELEKRRAPGPESKGPSLLARLGARPEPGKSLAFFSIFHPVRAGMADYSDDLVSELCRHYDITCYVGDGEDPEVDHHDQLAAVGSREVVDVVRAAEGLIDLVDLEG